LMESAPARDQSDPTQSPFAVGHDIARMLAGEGMHGAANGDLLCLGQFLLRVSRFRDIKHIEMEQLMRGICPLDQRHNGSFDVARTSAHGRASVPQAKQHLNPRPHRHGVEPHARADARRFVAAGGTGSCGGDGGGSVARSRDNDLCFAANSFSSTSSFSSSRIRSRSCSASGVKVICAPGGLYPSLDCHNIPADFGKFSSQKLTNPRSLP